MKTHDLAMALKRLSEILRAAPNIELDSIEVLPSGSQRRGTHEEIAVSLSTLAALSRVDRQQWLSLIHDYGFPVQVRPRDASRDILGKLLRYLEENPTARAKLKDGVYRTSGQASPELMKALASLLKE